MSLTSNVNSGTSGSGTNVSGQVRDDSGGGGQTRDVEVLMCIEDDKIQSYGAIDPQPHKTQLADGQFQVWWRVQITSHQNYSFKVDFSAKQGAEGPTLVGLSIHSDPSKPISDHLFMATTAVIYHASYPCKEERPLALESAKKVAAKTRPGPKPKASTSTRRGSKVSGKKVTKTSVRKKATRAPRKRSR